MAEYIEREALLQRLKFKRDTAVKLEKRYGLDSAISQVRKAQKADVEEVVHCVDCEYLMFSDMYGECRKAHLGIVSPHDFCSRGQRRRNGG